MRAIESDRLYVTRRRLLENRDLRALALTVGYILFFGGAGLGIFNWATQWTRDPEDPLVVYRAEISAACYVSALVGAIVLYLNGEDVTSFFGVE